MKIIYFLSLLFISGNCFAQTAISIICPADVTVHLFDLDDDYLTYGEPEVLSQEPYELEKNISNFNTPCQLRYTIIKYTAVSDSGSSQSCEQRVEINLPTLEDITFPDDFEINGIYVDDAEPELTGRPEPWDQLQGNSQLYSTYDDVRIIPDIVDVPVKILRRWTVLDWCTGNVKEQHQVIKIYNALGLNTGTSFTVESCAGLPVSVNNIRIVTDQSGYQVSTDNCDLSNNNLLDYVNCVAENNDINSDKSFILELEGPDDHLNGVSTLDMVLIQRHILAVNALQGFCKQQASDVNSDGRISAFDLLLMRKLILGQSLSFPSGSSWRFYNERAQELNLPASQKDLKFAKSEFPLSELNIIAVKLGDVNGTAQ